MPYIKGMLGNKVIAEENFNAQSTIRKQRKLDDPIRYIHIDCKIPQNIKYNVESMDVFNFAEELQKIQLVPYQEVLKLEGEFSDAFANFKYWYLSAPALLQFKSFILVLLLSVSK